VRRVPPSTVIREEIDPAPQGWHGTEKQHHLDPRRLGPPLHRPARSRTGAGGFLGDRHTTSAVTSPPPRGFRNGYEDATIKTGEGEAPVRVPQVREADEPYRSKLMDFLDGNSDVLERLVVEMYARGLSTRDVEDCFRDATGALLISRSAVSEITDQLWEPYQGLCHRDLSRVRRLLSLRGLHLREPAPLRGQGGDPRRLAITSGATPSFKGAGHCLSERWPRLH
jgi:Transposase, Mutator family